MIRGHETIKKLGRSLPKSNVVDTMVNAILSSSVVERSAVNRLVVGSNPTWGVFNSKLVGSL